MYYDVVQVMLWRAALAKPFRGRQAVKTGTLVGFGQTMTKHFRKKKKPTGRVQYSNVSQALPIYYCAWGTFGERERERERYRERERRKWRHCRAKIGDEFSLSLAKNSHNWRWAYKCQKFALFVSPFTLPVSPCTERSPLWRWSSQWVPTFHCQKFFRPLCSPSFKWHEPHDEWSKTQVKWSNPAQSYFVLPIKKLNQINTKNYWK